MLSHDGERGRGAGGPQECWEARARGVRAHVMMEVDGGAEILSLLLGFLASLIKENSAKGLCVG